VTSYALEEQMLHASELSLEALDNVRTLRDAVPLPHLGQLVPGRSAAPDVERACRPEVLLALELAAAPVRTRQGFAQVGAHADGSLGTGAPAVLHAAWARRSVVSFAPVGLNKTAARLLVPRIAENAVAPKHALGALAHGVCAAEPVDRVCSSEMSFVPVDVMRTAMTVQDQLQSKNAIPHKGVHGARLHGTRAPPCVVMVWSIGKYGAHQGAMKTALESHLHQFALAVVGLGAIGKWVPGHPAARSAE